MPTSSTSTCWPTGSRPSPAPWRWTPHGRAADRLLRRQHRGRRSTGGSRRTRQPRAGHRVPLAGGLDLAGDRLPLVDVPTLLVVGGRDAAVLGLNHRALRRLRCRNRLAVVPGASHLFEEPGTLDAVARLATEWFRVHLASHAPADRRSPHVRGRDLRPWSTGRRRS